MMIDPQKHPDTNHHSLPPPEPHKSPRTTMTSRDRATLRAKFGASILADSFNRTYDMDGDGKLDAIEQTMMKYDKNGDGQFSNAEIYQIIEEQLKIERKAGRIKRMIGGMSCFLMLLALSNLGTSFAAMFLSKELVAEGDVMRVQGTGDLAAVQSAAETMDLTPLSEEEYEMRKLLVLRDLELDPHSHTHRRLKKKDKKGKDDDDDSEKLMFDNGKINEKDFRAIEDKCKQQKNVKIRRTKSLDKQADSICSAGTSVVVKEKKKGGKEKEYKEKSQRVGNKNYKGGSKDREVMIRNSSGKSMNVDCVGDNCYISGDILLGAYGESCDRRLDDCEAHLTCDNTYGKDASARMGTCMIPRFVKTGGACDLYYMEEACEKGSYCSSDDHVVIRGSGDGNVRGGGGDDKFHHQHENHSLIKTGAANSPRFKLGTKMGICVKQVGVGALCNSPFACIKDFVCTGPGGVEIGAAPHTTGAVDGASGSVRWNVDIKQGICI